VTLDLKHDPRVKDPVLLSILHRDWRECVVCGEHRGGLSLHHVFNKPRDDLRENLVMLCGDGVRGCHGAIEAGNRETREMLGRYIYEHRPDIIEYLSRKLVRPNEPPSRERALAWMERRLCFPY